MPTISSSKMSTTQQSNTVPVPSSAFTATYRPVSASRWKTRGNTSGYSAPNKTAPAPMTASRAPTIDSSMGKNSAAVMPGLVWRSQPPMAPNYAVSAESDGTYPYAPTQMVMSGNPSGPPGNTNWYPSANQGGYGSTMSAGPMSYTHPPPGPQTLDNSSHINTTDGDPHAQFYSNGMRSHMRVGTASIRTSRLHNPPGPPDPSQVMHTPHIPQHNVHMPHMPHPMHLHGSRPGTAAEWDFMHNHGMVGLPRVGSSASFSRPMSSYSMRDGEGGTYANYPPMRVNHAGKTPQVTGRNTRNPNSMYGHTSVGYNATAESYDAAKHFNSTGPLYPSTQDATGYPGLSSTGYSATMRQSHSARAPYSGPPVHSMASTSRRPSYTGMEMGGMFPDAAQTRANLTKNTHGTYRFPSTMVTSSEVDDNARTSNMPHLDTTHQSTSPVQAKGVSYDRASYDQYHPSHGYSGPDAVENPPPYSAQLPKDQSSLISASTRGDNIATSHMDYSSSRHLHNTHPTASRLRSDSLRASETATHSSAHNEYTIPSLPSHTNRYLTRPGTVGSNPKYFMNPGSSTAMLHFSGGGNQIPSRPATSHAGTAVNLLRQSSFSGNTGIVANPTNDDENPRSKRPQAIGNSDPAHDRLPVEDSSYRSEQQSRPPWKSTQLATATVDTSEIGSLAIQKVDSTAKSAAHPPQEPLSRPSSSHHESIVSHDSGAERQDSQLGMFGLRKSEIEMLPDPVMGAAAAAGARDPFGDAGLEEDDGDATASLYPNTLSAAHTLLTPSYHSRGLGGPELSRKGQISSAAVALSAPLPNPPMPDFSHLSPEEAEVQQRLWTRQVQREREWVARQRLKAYVASLDFEGRATTEFYGFGKVLGVGSFGEVRLAWHRLAGAKVAIKSYEKSKLTEPTHWRRVQQEIRLMERLNHPHLIRHLEMIDSSKRIHIVMEYAGGGNLCSYVKARTRLSEPEARKIFLQLLTGIEYMHDACIIHRDIKLENVLFDEEQNNVKLTDFGFSVLVKDPSKRLKIFCGTPSYMAPEITQRKEYLGRPVDVWSLAVLLFAMLAGHFPFTAKSYPDLYKRIASGVVKFPDHFSAAVKDLLRRMLHPDPLRRLTLAHARMHPWVTPGLHAVLTNISIAGDKSILINDDPANDVNEAVIRRCEALGHKRNRVIASILSRARDAASTTYYLLLMRMGRSAKVTPSSSSQTSSNSGRGRSRSIAPSSQTSQSLQYHSNSTHGRPGTSVPSTRSGSTNARNDVKQAARPITSHYGSGRGGNTLYSGEWGRNKGDGSRVEDREDETPEPPVDANVVQQLQPPRSRTGSSSSNSSAIDNNKKIHPDSSMPYTNGTVSSFHNSTNDNGTLNSGTGFSVNAAQSSAVFANNDVAFDVESAKDTHTPTNPSNFGTDTTRQQESSVPSQVVSSEHFEAERNSAAHPSAALPPTHTGSRLSNSMNMYMYNPAQSTSANLQFDSTTGVAPELIANNTTSRLATLSSSSGEGNESGELAASRSKKRSISMSLPQKISPTTTLAPSIQSAQNTVVPLPPRPLSARPLSARPKSATRRPVLSDLTAAAIGSLAK